MRYIAIIFCLLLAGCERVESGSFVTDKAAFKRDFLDCVEALPAGSGADAIETCNDSAYKINTTFVRAK